MNDNIIQSFADERFGTVRALAIDGEPWFVAKDLADALSYKNTGQLTRILNGDEKGVQILHTPGGDQQFSMVNEVGFYHAVLQRRSSWIQDEAKRSQVESFQRWVTHEVLPAIRRHGAYATAETAERMIADPDFAIRTFEALRDERERRRALEAENAELRPKALFADAVAASDGTCLVGELAKMIRQNGVRMGQNRLFALLREKGYLGKSGSNYNVPTQRSMELGLFRIKETAVTHSDGHVTISRTPKVTGKGQRFFIERFGDPALAF